MTIFEALRYIQARLQEKLGEFAIPQSEEILETLLQCSRTSLYIRGKNSVPDEVITKIDSIIDRRLQGEPLQYIIGKVFFHSREFFVSPDVLIPRPDTEILIEQVLLHEHKEHCTFADIGTGSGIIACTLSESRPTWKGFGIDLSYKSLLVAKQNLHSPVHLLCSDLLSAVKNLHLFDFIVSNPPYISENEMNLLDYEVREFEPWQALFGGKDGLDFYRYLAINAKEYIISKGAIYCEIGYNQAQQIREIFSKNGWDEIAIFKDFGDRDRVLRATTR